MDNTRISQCTSDDFDCQHLVMIIAFVMLLLLLLLLMMMMMKHLLDLSQSLSTG